MLNTTTVEDLRRCYLICTRITWVGVSFCIWESASGNYSRPNWSRKEGGQIPGRRSDANQMRRSWIFKGNAQYGRLFYFIINVWQLLYISTIISLTSSQTSGSPDPQSDWRLRRKFLSAACFTDYTHRRFSSFYQILLLSFEPKHGARFWGFPPPMYSFSSSFRL